MMVNNPYKHHSPKSSFFKKSSDHPNVIILNSRDLKNNSMGKHVCNLRAKITLFMLLLYKYNKRWFQAAQITTKKHIFYKECFVGSTYYIELGYCYLISIQAIIHFTPFLVGILVDIQLQDSKQTEIIKILSLIKQRYVEIRIARHKSNANYENLVYD